MVALIHKKYWRDRLEKNIQTENVHIMHKYYVYKICWSTTNMCLYCIHLYMPRKKSETMTKDIYLNQPFFPVAGECRRASICFLLVYRTTSILSITSIFLYLKCIIYTLYKYVLLLCLFTLYVYCFYLSIYLYVL